MFSFFHLFTNNQMLLWRRTDFFDPNKNVTTFRVTQWEESFWQSRSWAWMLPRVCHIYFPVMQKNGLASPCILIDRLMSQGRFHPFLLLMQRPYSRICDKCWRWYYCCTTWILFFFCVTTIISRWSHQRIEASVPSISPSPTVCSCIAWLDPPGPSVDLPNSSSEPAPHPLRSVQLTHHLSF